MISLIAALDQNYGIGKDNNLLCRLRDDMKKFKSLTTGNVVVMGRKTFNSLPKGALPDRENIVLSKNTESEFPGCSKMNSVDEVLEYEKKSNKKFFIIGGGQIYNAFLPFADEMHLSFINHSFNADTFFPKINHDSWQIIDQQRFLKSERNEYSFTYKLLSRITE